MSKDRKLSNEFFEDEVRCGFFVPAIIKQEWAVGLDILKEIDRICEKHHLQYFADWGTLLAAVRHGGYIPWDDDLDIVMKRDDYNIFCDVAERELPEGFELHNYKNRDDYWQFTSKVLNKGRICFEQEHLERFHQFPYMVGVDIFVLDYLARDERENLKRNEETLFAIALGDGIGAGKNSGEAVEKSLKRIEDYSKESVSRELSALEMRRRLYEIAEHLMARYSENESDELMQLFPFGLKGKGKKFPKKYFKDSVRLSYENMSIPVSPYYDAIVRNKIKCPMQLIKNKGAHEYPYFEDQIIKLNSVLDFELPSYRFSEDQLARNVKRDEATFKGLVQESIDRLRYLLDTIQTEREVANGDKLMMYLQESQQLAIDLGTLIENVKGEGGVAVASLENYCEAIFSFSESISNNQKEITDTTLLVNVFEQTADNIEKDILRRKEIVFLPCKAAYWKYMEPLWETAVQDDAYDVFVVPIPYYYKRYDGTVTHEYYDAEEYPQHIYVTDYRAFDLQLHHPDKIVFQHPYDEWNPVTSVSPQYFSENLQMATDELIYISPYVTDEFGKADKRAYHNTQYYVPMPGIVRADRIYVQSENMKQIYIERLCEFAGRETESVWNSKIRVLSPTAKIHNHQNSKCSDTKRKILFYINAGFLCEYGECGLIKIEKVFEKFKKLQEEVQLVFMPNDGLEETTKHTDRQLYADYLDLLKKKNLAQWGAMQISEDEWQESKASINADAYYGDIGRYALEFLRETKLVMILNMDI